MSNVVSFTKVPQKTWDAIFGTPEEIQARRQAHRNPVRAHNENVAAAVHTGSERHYRVKHDPGLGCGYNSRQERAAILKKKGFVCVG